MSRVRPFRFSGLRHFTAEQVALQESMATYLSYRPFSADFAAALGADLEKCLKVPCGFGQSEMRPVARGDLGALLPTTACLLVIGAAPTEHKILVDLDMNLATFAIDRLLGGPGEGGRVQRRLTEIEEGVLSYVLLRVLNHFSTGLERGRELALTLDRFASRLADVQDIVDQTSTYHLLGIRVAAGRATGYARILVPQQLVDQSFSRPTSQAATTDPELMYMRRVLHSLADVPVVARVQVATLDLEDDDIANLEVGDIVVLEKPTVTQTPQGLAGQAFVKIGTGDNGGLQCRLEVGEGSTHLQIMSIVVQEKPLEADMVQEVDPADVQASGESTSDDNLAEAQGLLRDVAAPVVVELGRIRMNAAQVARLRSGQILRLPRGPNDPVDLVVHGKLFARGELIEVDGELGVRLMQVVGIT